MALYRWVKQSRTDRTDPILARRAYKPAGSCRAFGGLEKRNKLMITSTLQSKHVTRLSGTSTWRRTMDQTFCLFSLYPHCDSFESRQLLRNTLSFAQICVALHVQIPHLRGPRGRSRTRASRRHPAIVQNRSTEQSAWRVCPTNARACSVKL